MQNSRRGLFLITILMCLIMGRNAQAISPPWFTLWNQIRYTIGEDDLVTVDPLDTRQLPYVVTVHVRNDIKARAMASVLRRSYTLGNISVVVDVVDSSGMTIQPANLAAVPDVVRTLSEALASNRLFIGAFGAATPIHPQGAVGVLFTRSVVQFFNDDLGELYSNYNEVAADVFRQVLILQYGGGTIDLLLGTQKPGVIPQLLPAN